MGAVGRVRARRCAVAALMLTAEVRDARRADIQRLLTNEAQVVATLLSPTLGEVAGSLDEEADRLGQLVGSRVTLIAEDGRVVGDSSRERRRARDAREPRDAVPRSSPHGTKGSA